MQTSEKEIHCSPGDDLIRRENQINKTRVINLSFFRIRGILRDVIHCNPWHLRCYFRRRQKYDHGRRLVSRGLGRNGLYSQGVYRILEEVDHHGFRRLEDEDTIGCLQRSGDLAPRDRLGNAIRKIPRRSFCIRRDGKRRTPFDEYRKMFFQYLGINDIARILA